MIIVGYLVEEDDKSCLIMLKRMNEMSKVEDIATMHSYLILSHTLFMVTNVHIYCYMFN